MKCMECGHKFKTLKAAHRAAYGNTGCPGCGGSDIDLDEYPELVALTQCLGAMRRVRRVRR